MIALARHAIADADVFLVGGTSAVLVGWRATTIDVDRVMRPESDAMLRAIPLLTEQLHLNVKLASPHRDAAVQWRDICGRARAAVHARRTACVNAPCRHATGV